MAATKRKSLCQGKSVKNPNRCKKVRGCKVAKGPKRTFCRTAKNRKRGARTASSKRRSARRPLSRGPFRGYNKRAAAELKRLGANPTRYARYTYKTR